MHTTKLVGLPLAPFSRYTSTMPKKHKPKRVFRIDDPDAYRLMDTEFMSIAANGTGEMADKTEGQRFSADAIEEITDEARLLRKYFEKHPWSAHKRAGPPKRTRRPKPWEN